MKTLFTALIFGSLIAGCTTAPTPTELDKLAKIRFGEPIPENQDYILVFEAGQEIPMITQIDGDLFDKTIDQRSTVTLKKSIYVHKEWASFDGVNWVDGDEFINVFLVVKIPDYDNPNPGLIHLKLDEKKQ